MTNLSSKLLTATVLGQIKSLDLEPAASIRAYLNSLSAHDNAQLQGHIAELEQHLYDIEKPVHN